MKTSISIVCAFALCGLAGCSSFKSTREFSDSYYTSHGYVHMSYWNQPDGSIELWVSCAQPTTDDFLLTEWRKYAAKLAKGRHFEGNPAIELSAVPLDALQDPRRVGEEPKGKQAKGVLRSFSKSADGSLSVRQNAAARRHVR